MLPTHVSRRLSTPRPRSISGRNGHDRLNARLDSRFESDTSETLARQWRNWPLSPGENFITGRELSRGGFAVMSFAVTSCAVVSYAVTAEALYTALMSTEDNKALVRRLYTEGINRRDAVGAAGFYAMDALNH